MKIRFLKYAFLLTSLTLVFTACSRYDDELDELRARMTLVEQRLDDINKDIEALHALVMEIKQGGYVMAVLPDEKDGKLLGYTLAFNDGRSVYLRMEASSAVEAPQVGVRQGEDGNWYWTVDGEWLLDGAGSKVLASSVSQNSVQMKFEGDSWYISYDGGSSWEKIPTKSSSGLSFSDVDTSNPDYVVITLSDGTQLRLPTWAAFDALQQQVKQLNINLSALSRIVSALQDNDYLISMTPMAKTATASSVRWTSPTTSMCASCFPTASPSTCPVTFRWISSLVCPLRW